MKNKFWFNKTIKSNIGGGAEWKDNMKIIDRRDCVRIKDENGEWSKEDQYGVFIPGGTCVINAWIKTMNDFSNPPEPWPDGKGRLQITIAPWGEWTNSDGTKGSDEKSIANMKGKDGIKYGFRFNKETHNFEKIEGEDINKGNETTSSFQGGSDKSVRSYPQPDPSVNNNEQEATTTTYSQEVIDDDIPF